MSGYIRIGNKRKGSKETPRIGEIVIDGDRKNPILGNPFILHDHFDKNERAKVIESYKSKFEQDWEINGPMRKETEKIASRVKNGEKVIMMCWCVGAPNYWDCHLNVVKEKIEKIIEK